MSSIQTKPADTTFSYWLTVGVNEPEQIPGTGLFGLKFKDIPSTHHLPVRMRASRARAHESLTRTW